MHIKVRVVTESKEDSLEQISEDRFRVFVREKAKNGQANKRVQELLGEYFEKPAGAFRIVSGHHSPSKIFEIFEETKSV